MKPKLPPPSVIVASGAFFFCSTVLLAEGKAEGPSPNSADRAPGSINAPTPSRADEPVAPKLSLARAARFLDAASLSWTRERKCGACHTNYPYLMARPSFKEFAGPGGERI